MKIKCNTIGAALGSLALLSTQGHTAQITWEISSVVDDAGNFIATAGPLITAINSDTVGDDATIGGVTFVGTDLAGWNAGVAGTGGVTVSSDSGNGNFGSTFVQGGIGSGNPPGITDAAFSGLLGSGIWNPQTVTLSGLTIGDSYLIQIIGNDSRDGRDSSYETVLSDGINDALTSLTNGTAGLNSLSDTAPGGGNPALPGHAIIGTFTADAATQTFELGGTTNGTSLNSGGRAHINGFQLRDITGLAGDTDGDGMTDIYESSNGLDINVNDANIDSDVDGILNIDEFNRDPQLPAGIADADGDGLLDGEEVDGLVNTFGTPVASGDQLTGGVSMGAATDPLNADSDDDSLSDGEEANGTLNTSFGTEATDPNSDDTDADFLPDEYEVLNALDPNDDGSTDPNNGELGDPDGDGLDNFLELENNTDPQDPDTDDDGFPDGGLVDGSGNPTGELIIEFDGEFFFVAGQTSDPLDPDTDDDKVLDGEEILAGDDGFVTDPNLIDTDADGVPDSFELMEGTDPSLATGSSETPNYASITWSVEPTDDAFDAAGTVVVTPGVGNAALRQDGTLVYAENFRGGDVVANGVPFTGIATTEAPRCSSNVITFMTEATALGTIYAGGADELEPLLDSFWWNRSPWNPHVLMTGLTIGEDYYVQFGTSEDRAGREGRYAVIDGTFGGDAASDPIGATHTIYGGPGTTALVFTGTFTATSETQMFNIQAFDGTGNTDQDQIFLGFLQLRIDDGSLPVSGEVVIVDCGFDANGDYFLELATDATGATVSESPDLATAFTAVAAGSVTIAGNLITIDASAIDANADGSSFFQVSF